MHVVVGVPDRDPAHPQVVAAGGQPDLVQVGRGDVPPLAVGEVTVDHRAGLDVLSRRDHQVVDRPLLRPDTGRGQRLLQQGDQPAEVPPAGLTHRRLQLGRVVEPADDPRVGVWVAPAAALLLRRPGRVQVADQPADPPAPRADLADHGRLTPAAASTPRPPRPPGAPPG